MPLSVNNSRVHIPIEKFSIEGSKRSWDFIASEEALHIRIEWGTIKKRKEKTLAFLMRTPGDDFALVIGFLFSEGVINTYSDIADIVTNQNSARVKLKPYLRPIFSQSERFSFSASSCGMCGKTSNPLAFNCYPAVSLTRNQVNASLFYGLPDKMREYQINFNQTGGLHASAFFDSSGSLLALKEDVGRHNALDKLIGNQLQSENPMPSILLLSGRVSVEIIQKAAKAAISIIAAIGAPSSLAVEHADKFDLTLIGFLKHNTFNLYSGGHRIVW